MLNYFSGTKPCCIYNKHQQGSISDSLSKFFFFCSPCFFARIKHYRKIPGIRKQGKQSFILCKIQPHEDFRIRQCKMGQSSGSCTLMLSFFRMHQKNEFYARINRLYVFAKTAFNMSETFITTSTHNVQI